MNRKNGRRIGWGALCTFALVGCAKPQMPDMGEMTPPPRPSQLADLEPWVGTWTVNGEMTMGSGKDAKTMRSTGSSTVSWKCDQWVLCEEMEHEMPDMPKMGKMKGVALYMWNADKKCFSTFYTNSMGEMSHGSMKYCPEKKCWCMTGKGKDPMSGQMSIFEGCVKMPDPNTMEWEFSAWNSWKTQKMMSGKGTAKKS